jgi:hypothetical protein
VVIDADAPPVSGAEPLGSGRYGVTLRPAAEPGAAGAYAPAAAEVRLGR